MYVVGNAEDPGALLSAVSTIQTFDLNADGDSSLEAAGWNGLCRTVLVALVRELQQADACRLLLWCELTELFMSAWRLEDDPNDAASRAKLDSVLPRVIASYGSLQATSCLFACEFDSLVLAFVSRGPESSPTSTYAGQSLSSYAATSPSSHRPLGCTWRETLVWLASCRVL